MTKIQNTKIYDLEDRTYKFAKRCRDFIKELFKTVSNIEYGKQLARSSGSQATNYIEANEAISRKDFFYRIKICRKETKESRLWLRLCDIQGKITLEKERDELIGEATELMKIFGSIVEKNN